MPQPIVPPDDRRHPGTITARHHCYLVDESKKSKFTPSEQQATGMIFTNAKDRKWNCTRTADIRKIQQISMTNEQSIPATSAIGMEATINIQRFGCFCNSCHILKDPSGCLINSE